MGKYTLFTPMQKQVIKIQFCKFCLVITIWNCSRKHYTYNLIRLIYVVWSEISFFFVVWLLFYHLLPIFKQSKSRLSTPEYTHAYIYACMYNDACAHTPSNLMNHSTYLILTLKNNPNNKIRLVKKYHS